MSSTLSTAPRTRPAKTIQGLFAVEQIRRMRGGTQPHLMRMRDGSYYVVKFPNNPQGSRVLVNELICSRLAARLGLPVAAAEVVSVDECLIRYTPELKIELIRGGEPCRSGFSFGSRYPGNPRRSTLFDLLPVSQLRSCHNITAFLGMLAFDIWTGNLDSRQAVFVRPDGYATYGAMMIDHGYCFGGGSWELSERPLAGLHMNRGVYELARNIDQFEPWLGQIETEIDGRFLLAAASEVPPEWYHDDVGSLQRLLDELYERRKVVRDKIFVAMKSYPEFFPNWKRAYPAAWEQ